MINILVCDDDRNITDEVYNLLDGIKNESKNEFNVDLKNHGDFIDLCNEPYYDIAIVDIEMPDIDGLELSERLKELNPDIIVIVLTSYQNYLDDAMRIHVFRYLSKPIDKNRFYENFNDALTEYKFLSKSINVIFEDEVHHIKTKDILYFENLKYGSQIHTKRGTFRTNKKADEWLSVLNQYESFEYSYKGILVNLQNVIDFNKTYVYIRKNKSEIITVYVSQRKYSSFKKSFFRFIGGNK
ncbi:LytR/AlgR family response regulator transcription factor [Eubacterium sp.]